ncbi:RHS repeat domain-containing protein [Chondrinema litorale]|uniref:RHS repeat domain-containing protein n=1 Tax=Chondrinema litorale TaxID=2994555 RepID=UPI00254392E0|nr:RHS repeat-associated core domain-containing protein [Chondrinema litorale]UZR97133.1 hypothetical protein OQ292_23840 [Chondrinema litorale]
MKIFVANESDLDVWFDDIEINYTPARIVQENHYYPFGLNLAGIEKQGIPDHKFQFQGVEREDAFGLNWDETDFRRYDPQLGRLTGIDAMVDQLSSITPYQYAFNNPISLNDPTGLMPQLSGDDIGGSGGSFFDYIYPNKENDERPNYQKIKDDLRPGYIATCPTCPDGAEYDKYKKSNLDYAYSSLVGGDGVYQMINEVTITSNPVADAASGGIAPEWWTARFNSGGFELGLGITFSAGPQSLKDGGAFGYSIGGNVTLLKFRPTLKYVAGEGFSQSTLGIDMAGGFDGETNASRFIKAEGLIGLFDVKTVNQYIFKRGSSKPILNKTINGAGTLFTELIMIHNRLNGKYEIKAGLQEDFAQSFGSFGLKFDFK